MWLIDTGCGHDLVGSQEIRQVKNLVRTAGKALILHTANGPTPAIECIDLWVRELGEHIEPYVLEDTPAVISIGIDA